MPKYAVEFVRWTLIITIVNSLSNTLITGLHASGKLIRYMVIVGMVEISNFPLTYLAFKLGLGPEAAYWVFALVYLVLMFLRLYLIKEVIYLKAKQYMKAVYLRVFPVAFIASLLPISVCCLYEDSILRFFIVSIVSLCSSSICIYLLGLDRHERDIIKKIVLSKFPHK